MLIAVIVNNLLWIIISLWGLNAINSKIYSKVKNFYFLMVKYYIHQIKIAYFIFSLDSNIFE
jgi:hypothetical protein